MSQALPEYLLIAVIGLCVGSFVTMASYRFTVEDENILRLILRRSFCPDCGKALRIRDLLPVFSWIFHKGRCGFCNSKIPIRYPLIEMATALAFVAVYKVSGEKINVQLLILLLMITILMIMVITDLENYFIPDITQIALGILIIIYHILNNDRHFFYYLFSAGLYVFFGLALKWIFLLIAKKEAIGIDDIKFFGIAGLLLGIDQFPVFMILSGGAGTIFGMIWQKITEDKFFPFAPALIMSLIISLFLKDKINYANLIFSLFS